MTSSNDFPPYWPFVRGIHRSPVNSPHKGQWRGALMFFFHLCLNNRLGKQWRGWWFDTPLCPLWRHCNVLWDRAQVSTCRRGAVHLPGYQMACPDICRCRSRAHLFGSHIHSTWYTWWSHIRGILEKKIGQWKNRSVKLGWDYIQEILEKVGQWNWVQATSGGFGKNRSVKLGWDYIPGILEK